MRYIFNIRIIIISFLIKFFQTYKKNLQKLHTMVLVKFDNDTIVKPAETELFGFYKPGQERLIQTLEQSDFYHKVYLFIIKIYIILYYEFFVNSFTLYNFHFSIVIQSNVIPRI